MTDLKQARTMRHEVDQAIKEAEKYLRRLKLDLVELDRLIDQQVQKEVAANG